MKKQMFPETEFQRMRRLQQYLCPSCKSKHKLAAFCPNTGDKTSVTVEELPTQAALNYQGSPQTVVQGALRMCLKDQ